MPTQAELIQFVVGCDAMDEHKFKQLPKPAQNWLNEALRIIKARKPLSPPSLEIQRALEQANPVKRTDKTVCEYQPQLPLSGEPIKFENGYSFEMDAAGWFRIADPNGQGEWTHYPGIALSKDNQFFAVSAYFGASGEWAEKPDCGLKAETLYRIEEIKRSS